MVENFFTGERIQRVHGRRWVYTRYGEDAGARRRGKGTSASVWSAGYTLLYTLGYPAPDLLMLVIPGYILSIYPTKDTLGVLICVAKLKYTRAGNPGGDLLVSRNSQQEKRGKSGGSLPISGPVNIVGVVSLDGSCLVHQHTAHTFLRILFSHHIGESALYSTHGEWELLLC